MLRLNSGKLPPLRLPALSNPTKITLLSVSLGVVVMGVLARYLRRKRKYLSSTDFLSPITVSELTTSNVRKNNNHLWKGHGPGSVVSPGNGDMRFLSNRTNSSFGSSTRHRSPSGSTTSSVQTQRLNEKRGSVVLNDKYSIASSSTMTIEATDLTPQQMGVMGLEALETAIQYWEDALSVYTDTPTPTGAEQLNFANDEAEFTDHIEKMLKKALGLQGECEQLFLNESSVLFRPESASAANSVISGSRRTITSLSTVESFYSCQTEIADLRDFEEFTGELDLFSLHFYQAGLKELEEHGILHRDLRTEYVHVATDAEYLAKLFCIRQAFDTLLKSDSVREYFTVTSKEIITNMLILSDKDPRGFGNAFDAIIEFVKDDSNWTDIEVELNGRGVKCMNFYDIALDFILMDAFEDLECPPSSVLAVVQNRWLSTGFKETALATAVWSVLRAKRRILKFSNGFIAHFYAITEILSPVLAWGFLGQDENLRDVCFSFKSHVLGFLQDIFSFNRVRYTTLEDLSADILVVAKQRFDSLLQQYS